MNAADVQVFNRVALLCSFQDAGDALGLSRSSISKRIARLESDLGVILFNRSSRRVSLTEAGRTFLQHSMGVDDSIERAAQSVRGADEQPSGTVTCSLPSSLGAALMPALVRCFHTRWPDLNLSVHFNDGSVDLIGESFDVAIRVANSLQNSNLVSRRIGTTPCVVVASPEYLAKHGAPQTLQALKAHRCLALGKPSRPRTAWRFQSPDGPTEIRMTPAVMANSYLALILAACLDEGILFVPEIYVGGELEQGRLQRLLEDVIEPSPLGVFAVYPSRNPPAKTKAFIEFFADELDALTHVDRWAPFATASMR